MLKTLPEPPNMPKGPRRPGQTWPRAVGKQVSQSVGPSSFSQEGTSSCVGTSRGTVTVHWDTLGGCKDSALRDASPPGQKAAAS